MRIGWTIFRYLIASVLPYFVFSWLLISVVLFVQQAGRFTDIFFSVNIPAGLIWQLSAALIPSVIAFTCPMAALVGILIGLTKMQSDSELVAIRAAGVGTVGIVLPIALLGVALSIFALAVNLQGVPFAAGIVRQVALRAALYKLESPIEPGAFNTEVAGFTIYVREGDIDTGSWKNIFIFNEDGKTRTTRLITSARGRIDYTSEDSELYLQNALSWTFVRGDGEEKYHRERIGEVRYAVKTRRSELLDRINNVELSPEELGLNELAQYARLKEGREKVEAGLLWQRRILLSITPFIFCILAAALVLRYNRGSRGFAVLSALVSLIVYYLLAFLGEQLARTGRISVPAAGLVPLAVSAAAMIWLFASARVSAIRRERERANLRELGDRLRSLRLDTSNLFVDLTTGLRDFDTIFSLLRYYALALGFLASVFLIFTAFENWRFAGVAENGEVLLAKYLFYLIPFVYISLAPSAFMIATLATYVVKSRQNEIVTWTSAGQSIYRLLLPCLALAAVIGLVNWRINESTYPAANRVQDELLRVIRNLGKPVDKLQKNWAADGNRIFSFSVASASDNEREFPLADPHRTLVKDLMLYEFDANNAELQSVYRSSEAVWERNRIIFTGAAEKLDLMEDRVGREVLQGGELQSDMNPFVGSREKPSHLSSDEMRERIEHSGSDLQRRSLSVSLERRRITPLLPLVIALFTAPFALSLSRKGKATTVGYAVGLWLMFMGVTSIFEQLGMNGTLPAAAAVWAPLVIFSMLGIVLLSRVRT
jgi:lipopolysaccharide export LptBFGC system permease protein LptF